MNKVMLMGRLTRDPEIRYSQGNNTLAIVRYSLAVERRFKRDGKEQQADFINCVAFGKSGEFAQKYFHQGIKVIVIGRIQTGSYTNKDGQKVYSTDVLVEEQEFAESKAVAIKNGISCMQSVSSKSELMHMANSGVDIPDAVDEELPFS